MSRINKKGTIDDPVTPEFIYVLVVIIVLFILGSFIEQKKDNSAAWEDYYANEVANMIDRSKPGDYLEIEVHKATEIAKKNKIVFDSIFNFEDGEVCVRLSSDKQSCVKYYSNVSVKEERVLLGGQKNLLPININEVGK